MIYELHFHPLALKEWKNCRMSQPKVGRSRSVNFMVVRSFYTQNPPPFAETPALHSSRWLIMRAMA